MEIPFDGPIGVERALSALAPRIPKTNGAPADTRHPPASAPLRAYAIARRFFETAPPDADAALAAASAI